MAFPQTVRRSIMQEEQTKPDAPPEKEAQPETKPKAASKPKGNSKADLGKRIVAAIIDAVCAFVVGLIPIIGGLIGAAYLLLRDGFEIDFMDQRSLGKKLMKLRPVLLDGGKVDLVVSIKRNWILAIPSILMIIPVFGWIAAPFLGLAIGIIEFILVITDPQGRRIGDKLAGTKVIEVEN
jgi:uncharacterized RDD family membrane protein YckC